MIRHNRRARWSASVIVPIVIITACIPVLVVMIGMLATRAV